MQQTLYYVAGSPSESEEQTHLDKNYEYLVLSWVIFSALSILILLKVSEIMDKRKKK